MTRHSLAAATGIICEGVGFKHPELWVARRLRSGEFSGLKIGRDWFMTDADIELAIQTCRRGSNAPAIPSATGDRPPAVSITDGLSARARKLRAS